MQNIDKRLLVIGIVVVALAFFAGSKLERYQQQKANVISLDLLTEDSRDAHVYEPEPVLIQVYVHGEVVYPGVYYLEENARVHEAIDEAGGLLPTARGKNLNLAARLRDGESLYIPSLDEDESQISYSSGSNAIQSGRININVAGLEELQRLPGIGPALAQRIVDYRSKNGYFKKIEDIKNVNGIGEKRFEDLKEQIDV